MQKCQNISFQVLSCFAIGLGFEEDFFTRVTLLYLSPRASQTNTLTDLVLMPVLMPYAALQF